MTLEASFPRRIGNADPLVRRRLLDLDFVDSGDVAEVADVVGVTPPAGIGLPLLVTPNVDIVIQLRHSAPPGVVEAFDNAWIVLPDGQPIVWLSRLVGQRLSSRLTGSDLFSELWARWRVDGTPVVMVVPSSEVARRLELEHPAASIYVAPMVAADDHEAIRAIGRKCAAQLQSTGATRVLFGLGHPKDTLLALALVEELGPDATLPVMCCLGGSFEMHLGMRRRAPEWMQRWSLEWLFRLVQEPRRLAYRYLVRDVAFVPIAVSEIRASRRRNR